MGSHFIKDIIDRLDPLDGTKRSGKSKEDAKAIYKRVNDRYLSLNASNPSTVPLELSEHEQAIACEIVAPEDIAVRFEGT